MQDNYSTIGAEICFLQTGLLTFIYTHFTPKVPTPLLVHIRRFDQRKISNGVRYIRVHPLLAFQLFSSIQTTLFMQGQ
jgi:hypothetical protein